MPPRRPHPADLALLVLGGVSVVAGGLVAALTGPLDLDTGSWAAAYLVLVGGVSSVAIGSAQTWLAPQHVLGGLGWGQFATWVLGHAAVMGGTLLGTPWVVAVGGLLLVLALVAALLAAGRPVHAGLGLVYRALLLIVLVSIPVGLVLSFLRAP